jgi:hypothetical protein
MFLPTQENSSGIRTASAVNLSISLPVTEKKIPSKTMSFQVKRAAPPSGEMALLPDHYDDDGRLPQASSPLLKKKNSFRLKACEKGGGDLLPLMNSQKDQYSNSLGTNWGLTASQQLADGFRSITQMLRSRRRLSSDSYYAELYSGSHDQVRNSWSSVEGFTKQKRRRGYLDKFQALKSEWMQMLVIGIVIFLVFDAYSKALAATDKLQAFSEEESIMMLHLQRIEQQSINLHENIARLSDVSSAITSGQDASQKDSIDTNLVRIQTQQLYQMEEELDHELRALQTKLQNVARSAIINTFGEGPVQVNFVLDFPDSRPDHDTVSILLWYDTPHAAWTWIQQIRKGEWNGATFSSKATTIEAAPVISNLGGLEFVEKSSKGHGAWTVGLADDNGSLRMFINMQDNVRKNDVCVGKVVDGFDALQELVDSSRRNSKRKVTIKQASVTHWTRQHGQRPLKQHFVTYN